MSGVPLAAAVVVAAIFLNKYLFRIVNSESCGNSFNDLKKETSVTILARLV
jgi:hypothetical protein